MLVKVPKKAREVGMRIAPRWFIKSASLDKSCMKIAMRISHQNFGRALVLCQFISLVSKKFAYGSTLKVAVVGGLASEPEIIALKQLGFRVESKIFGIEKSSEYLDLNQQMEKFSDTGFHLVLCSQVWEHLWCHANAFVNITRLMSVDSYLWLACPASNRAHASPDYFSAGFTSDYLNFNLAYLGLSVLNSGQLGSARNYRATHTMPIWLSVKSHRLPILNSFPGYNFFNRIALILRYFFRNLELFLFSPKITSDVAFATESWVFAQKTDDARPALIDSKI